MQHGNDVWTRQPINRPVHYAEKLARSKPILMIGNLKGGVGKTTLAANLAGFYHSRKERVLLVDLDYQGSLSAMTIDESQKLETPLAMMIFENEAFEPYRFKGREGSAVINCFYEFAEYETRIMLEWLAGRRGDIRFALADYLLSDAVQDRFDRIILDTAPRVSTGFVNAFCAATHLLIPTRLDALSAETVESFLAYKDRLMGLRCHANQTRRMRAEQTYLSYQVVGTMKRYDNDRAYAGESDAIVKIEKAIERDESPLDRLLSNAYIPARAGFARDAGFDIAYFNDPEVALFINRLADAIETFVPSKWSRAA